MKKEYAFSKMKQIKNPYAKLFKNKLLFAWPVIWLNTLKNCQQKQALPVKI